MSPPGRHRRATGIPLDGMTEAQRAVVLHDTTIWLAGLAGDLCRYGPEDIGRVTEEVAALGRLVWGCQVTGWISAPDPVVRRLVERRLGETEYLEEMEAEYEVALAEHDAWVALAARLDEGGADA